MPPVACDGLREVDGPGTSRSIAQALGVRDHYQEAARRPVQQLLQKMRRLGVVECRDGATWCLVGGDGAKARGPLARRCPYCGSPCSDVGGCKSWDGADGTWRWPPACGGGARWS